jgi:amino acid transporter
MIFVLINGFITFRGIKFTAIVDWVFFAIEIATVLAFVAVGIAFITGPNWNPAPDFNVIDPIFDAGKIDLGFIAAAASIACLSFLGFDGISTLAEETKNPGKTVGKATLLSLLFIGVIFIALTWVAEIIWGGQPVTDETKMADTGFFDIAEQAGGMWLRMVVMLVLIIASGIPNAVAAQSAITRILFSMSRDGTMPGFMRKVHPKYKTPYLTIIFISVFTLGASFIGSEQLTRLVNFGGISSFIVLNFAVFWFFFIKEKQRNSVKDWIRYLVCPVVGMFILGFVWSGFPPLTLIVGFVWLAIGIVVGAVRSKGYKEVPPAFQDLN